MEVSIKKKEAYYTATQMQLVRTRFFGNRSAMIAGSILLFVHFLYWVIVGRAIFIILHLSIMLSGIKLICRHILSLLDKGQYRIN